MSRPTALALAFTVLASTALAKPPDGVRWAASWQAASDEAKERNVPILVVFVHQDADGAALEKAVLAGKEFTAASQKWVTVYCNKDDGQPEKKEGDKSFSAVTPGITVEQHKTAWKELSARCFKADDAKAPSVVWCGPDGEEAGRIEGPITSRDLLVKMAEASKKTGPGLEAGDYVEALGHISAGEAASKDSKVGDAIREYGEVVKMQKKPGAKGVVARAQAALDRINAAGKVTLDLSKDCVAAQDYDKAKKLIKDVMDTYRGLPVAKDAETYYAQVCEESALHDKQKKNAGNGKK